MTIRGVYGKPYVDFSNVVDVDWLQSLHTEFAAGLARSELVKRVVSCGARHDEPELEACKVLYNPENYMNSEQIALFRDMNMEQKLWFISFLLPVYHPYHICYIRPEREFENKNRSDRTFWHQNEKNFPSMRSFVEHLPFKEVGRILFFITEHNHRTLIHFDAGSEEKRKRSNHDFLTMWTRPHKRLFVWDEDTDRRYYVDTPVAYFNELDWHGTDAAPIKTFTFRVEGVFEDWVHEQMRTMGESLELNTPDKPRRNPNAE